MAPIANQPSQNNNRASKEIFWTPRLSFVKTAYLSNVFNHCVPAYLFYFQPEYVSSYFFERKSDVADFELTKFCAFYQGLPIFLALFGLRPINSRRTKNYFLPLAINDFFMALAIYTLKSNPWSAVVIIIITFLILSMLVNLFSFFIVKLKKSPVFII